eukprot:Phypoly_transcript_23331.p1 GENE.Phypoly_transcript_23331~~Phypoly_transcript_23331.p1  ORF type:complete len:144 (+),score=23.72 Phypoly_transcript_23331:108-539(+)
MGHIMLYSIADILPESSKVVDLVVGKKLLPVRVNIEGPAITIKEIDELDFDTTVLVKDLVLQEIDERYGKISGIGIGCRTKGGLVMDETCVMISLWKKLPKKQVVAAGLQVIPPFFIFRLPNGDAVKVYTDVNEHGFLENLAK